MDKLKVFEDMELHLLEDEHPAKYLNKLPDKEVLSVYPFSMLKKLKFTEQSPTHHPEGNVWNHTMMVVEQAARVREKSKNIRAFMWAALLHDIGKPDTTRKKKGKITSYDHDIIGAALARDFLSELTLDEILVRDVEILVKWHMHIIFVLNDLPYGDISGLFKEADIHEVSLLGWCDRTGRGNADIRKEDKNIRLFIKKMNYLKNN